MKKLILFTFISLLAQLTIAQEAPEKANTIIISLSDTNKLHDKIVKLFAEKGYSMRVSKNANIFLTEAKTLKNNSRVNLTATVKDKDLILTGSIVVVAQGNMKIENKGKKGTPIFVAWEEMDKVAKSFGSKVSYEIK